MKKLSTLFLLLLFALQVQAQFTFTPADWPAPGTSVQLIGVGSTGSFSLVDSVNLGSTPFGPFDFDHVEDGIQDSMNIDFVAASSTPHSAAHPGSDMALALTLEVDSLGNSVATVIRYFDLFATGINEQGLTYELDSGLVINGTPNGNMITRHATYSAVDSAISINWTTGYSYDGQYDWTIAVDSGLIHSENHRNSIDVEGFGLLTHPSGATFGAYRVRVENLAITLDSTASGIRLDSAYNFELRYEFWTQGAEYPIVIVSVDSTTQQPFYLNYIEATPVSVESPQALTFTVYPIPTAGEFTLRFAQPLAGGVKLWMMNGLGQFVHSEYIAPGTAAYSVEAGELPAGLYHAILADETGKTLGSQKVVIR